MIKILHVEAENFRSYPELSYDISDKGLTVIAGKDDKTKRSNGSGKSTLLDLAAFIWYGKLPRGGTVDSVIRLGQTKCFTQGTFQVNNQIWKIARSRGPDKLSLEIDGVKQDKKVADLKILLETTMPPELFELACYVSQDRNRSFFSMTDGQRTDLFSILANAREMDLYLMTVKAERDQIKSELIKTQSAKEVTEGIAKESDTRIETMRTQLEESRLAPESIRQRLEQCKTQLDRTRADSDAWMMEEEADIRAQFIDPIESVIENLQALQDAKANLEKESIVAMPIDPALQQAVVETKQKGFAAHQHNKHYSEITQHNAKIKMQIDHLTAHIPTADAAICKSCGQSLPEQTVNDMLEESIKKIEALHVQMKAVPEMIPDSLLAELEKNHWDARSALEAARLNAEDGPRQIANQLLIAKLEISKAEAELRSLQNRCEQLIKDARTKGEGSLQQLEQQVALLEQKFQSESDRVQTLENTLRDELDRKLVRQTQIAQFKDSLKQLDTKAEESGELMILFGPAGYRASQFTESVSRVSEIASEYLSRMTDGQFSTRLDQVTENSKGEPKIVLRPALLQGGQVVTHYDSGGQLRGAALAYDLAINAVAANGLPLLADEILNGLDSSGKFMAMELLNEIARERPIILIDHDETLQTAADKVWHVKRDLQGNSVLIK